MLIVKIKINYNKNILFAVRGYFFITQVGEKGWTKGEQKGYTVKK